MMVEAALSTSELTVADDMPSETERKEVDKTLSETGPTGVGTELSVAEVMISEAELMMSDAEIVLMEVLMPATELSQLVTVMVTVAVAPSCEVARAPVAAGNA